MDPTKPARRWYRLTPGRLIAGLLAVEGFLWLSQHFAWFAFNRHKGWTVLIAVAAVGAVLAVMLVWWLAAAVFRLRFQFSIRSLLVVALAVALPSSWLAAEMRKAKTQKEAVAEIVKLGGTVSYDWQVPQHNPSPAPRPPGAAWLRAIVGEDFFADVVYASFQNPMTKDSDLVNLKGLTALQVLSLAGTRVTDAGLVNIKGLTALEVLQLNGIQVTDAGLVQLQGLTALHALRLDGTQVTDAGLMHLQGLKALRELRLDGMQVGDAGLVNLKCLTALQRLVLDCTQVTDAGLANLKGLSSLHVLSLQLTHVTDAGLVNLDGLTALEELRLNGTPVTDAGLLKLKSLTSLRELWLSGTRVTKEGVTKLQKALPSCGTDY